MPTKTWYSEDGKIHENCAVFYKVKEVMKEILQVTCDRLIVEKSRKDRFWGAVEERDDNLHGRNQLGLLLKELRSLVKTKSIKELTTVKPLDIPNFLLLDEPINEVCVILALF